ncbi:SWIM zinc finger family protein [Ruegeria marisrubri]|uniref:SWIM zinc finger family protein n=1 Tax=Ruegeria marisrubri TaxID=1685379 RepID=UPI001CD1B328|nr:SWIM zinc finger family protein [Ruegeria marisrubri]MCA0905149.1 SWIM zinc finger family protein [Ruegeria marisrubri]
MKFTFKSSSSDAEYTVTVEKTQDDILIFCTCPAGENGQQCKHRLSILEGDDSKVISATHPASEVAAILPGTRLGNSLVYLRECEAMLASSQAALKKAKKQVARAMHGHF